MTITKKERPFRKDPHEELSWLLAVLGSRQTRRHADIVLRVIDAMKRGEKFTVSSMVGPRTTLSYHLSKLVQMGILRRAGRGYVLRASNFERTIEEIRKDVERIFDELLRVAKELDALLGLPRG